MVANLDIYFRFLEDVQDDRCLTLSHLKIKNIKLANAVNMPSSVSSSKFTKGTLSQVDGKSLNSRPQTLSTIIESLPSSSHGHAMYVNIKTIMTEAKVLEQNKQRAISSSESPSKKVNS